MTPKKYPHKKKFHFSENPKNIEIQNVEPKNDPSLRMYEHIRVSPFRSPWGLALRRPGSLNRLSISYGRFFVGGGGPGQQIWSRRNGQFTSLAAPGSEGTRYRLRYESRIIWPFPFSKIHNNMNKMESFSS